MTGHRAIFWLLLVFFLARPAFGQPVPVAIVPVHDFAAVERAWSKAATVAIGGAMVGQFTDLAVTEYAIGAGVLREANPILAPLAHRPVEMAIAKGTMAVGVSYALVKLKQRHPKAAFWTAVVLAGVQAGVTWHNARALRERP